MKNGKKWVLALAGMFALSTAVYGGGQSGSGAGSSASGDITINIRVMNEFKNLDKIIAQYNELTKNDPVMSKIHPNFTWITGGDYSDKLRMALIAEENFDLMFCGGWHGLTSYIQQGNFADISSYYNNDAYPGLKKAFAPDFVEAMTTYVRQSDGSYKKGIYGVNLVEAFEDTRGLMYREDLRKKYNCAPITDEKTLMAYLDTVLAGEKANGEEWLGLNLWNFFRFDSPFYSGKHENVFAQDSTNILGDQTHFYIGLSSDKKTVLNAVVAGDSPGEFAKMPRGYQNDFITAYTVERTKWNKYLSPLRGTADTELRAALAAYSTLTEFESKVRDDLSANPGAEYGFYVFEDAQRAMQKGAVICDMVTNNWLVVPEWSAKKDAVMRFLDWMFGTQEHHDLFQYGIQGQDWTAVGTDSYRAGPAADNVKYVMPGYSMTWNSTFIRKSEFAKTYADLDQRFNYIYSVDTYQLSPLSGFSFDRSPVETEIANVSALSNELQLILSKYEANEAVAKINAWHAEAARVGLEKIRAELIRQVQAFLNVKNGR